MKLYYLPGACSLAAHIVLNELAVPAQFVRVDRATRKAEDGTDYLTVNPNGYVPGLRLDDGQVLTENVAILSYLADLRPEAGLAPPSGFGRYRLLQWLSYVNSELHGAYKPFFGGDEAAKEAAGQKLKQRYRLVEQALERPFLLGEQPSVADFYLFVVTNWAGRVNLDLSEFTRLAAFMERMRARPAVQTSLREEGLSA